MENPLGHRLRELPGPVLLTGHTGFKGTWMTFLLEHLNIPVVGYSLEAEKDSLFDRAERSGAIPEVFEDIRDYETLEKFIDDHKPSTIIHMAAQPLVLKSYESPRETFDINVMGSVNILDIAFKKEFIEAIIVVTTDKVYRNNNSGRAFVETDALEGKDPYSASKVGTEAVVAAWQQISKLSGGPKVTSVRAGNVIGGGDFARDRLIPDLIRSIISKEALEIRNGQSTRPWEHVIEPLIGYLSLLEFTLEGGFVPALNFGPASKSLKVNDVINIVEGSFPGKIMTNQQRSITQRESTSLELNPNLAKELLNWETAITQEQAIKLTADWWRQFIEGKGVIPKLCEANIEFLLQKHTQIEGNL